MSTILLVIDVLLLLGALPRWPHSRKWDMARRDCLALCIVLLARPSRPRADLSTQAKPT
jgi:hypothetical protein